MQEQGSISIHTENIFPIIKKFLYSDHEIFLRELVSNAVDATQKIKNLSTFGEYKDELGELNIVVKKNEEAKTLTIIDRGIGLTAEEVKKYINQIAFSGATEFVEKYKEKSDQQQMIGMFGLGFYSAFMVSSKVEIISKSFQEGSEAVKWSCDGSTTYEIEKAEKEDRGTEIILYLDEDSEEFLADARIEGILNKYCKFLPVPIIFGTREETKKVKEGEEEKEEKIVKDHTINNTNPVWVKNPSELKEEDYLKFYKELYPASMEEPLFWVHLNVDYPFNLTGVLYFPKVKEQLDLQRNNIQLYSKQVFITDEVKDIVPEFLQLLHGVIDSPDIPLNVSRSYLQSDSNVKKINNYISKKVAEKLNEIFKKDRKSFEDKWSSVGVFVKYGLISDEKFYDRATKFTLLENTESKFSTLEEYKEYVKETQTDKDSKVVYLYASDLDKQHAYIESAKARGYDVIKLDGPLDNHLANTLEQKLENVQFKRVDADIVDKLIEKEEKLISPLSEDEEKSLKELFDKAIENPSYTVSVEPVGAEDQPLIITLPEFMRRMKEMSQQGGMAMFGQMPDQYNVVLNAAHPLIRKIADSKTEEEKISFAKQLFDLGLLSQNLLTGAKLSEFLKRSVDLIK